MNAFCSRFFLPALLLGLLSFGFAPAWAHPLEEKIEKQDWQQLSPEERERLHQQMREAWKQLSPEERERLRDQIRETWKQLSPKERETYRHLHREYRERLKECAKNKEGASVCLGRELPHLRQMTPETQERLRELSRDLQKSGRKNRPESPAPSTESKPRP
jgi:hypothetical protein